MREKRFINYAEVQTVLVLFESERSEGNVEVGEIVRQLQRDGKRVVALGYAAKCQIITAKAKIFRIFGKCERKSKEVCAIAEGQHFDMVLDLTLRPVKPIMRLLALTDSPMRVGLEKGQEGKDLDVRIGFDAQSPMALYEEVKHYLSIIKAVE